MECPHRVFSFGAALEEDEETRLGLIMFAVLWAVPAGYRAGRIGSFLPNGSWMPPRSAAHPAMTRLMAADALPWFSS